MNLKSGIILPLTFCRFFFIHLLLKSVDNVFCPGMLSFWMYPPQKDSFSSFWTCIICFICFVLFLSKFSPLLVFHDIKIRALPRKRGNCCRDSFEVMRKVLLFQCLGFFCFSKYRIIFLFLFSSIYKIIFVFFFSLEDYSCSFTSQTVNWCFHFIVWFLGNMQFSDMMMSIAARPS